MKEFDTYEDAKAHIDRLLGVKDWHSVNVQINGAESGEDASPLGTSYVASGDPFVLTVAGTPSALYDNGVDQVASISENKYTISNVEGDHNIAVIF